MKSNSRLLLALGILMSVVLAWLPDMATAHEYKVGTIKVVHPWAAPTPAGAPVAAAYLEIQNLGSKPTTFLGASSPNAERVEIHSMTMTGGIMKMRPVPGGVRIGPHKKAELNRSGMHLMLFGITKPLGLEEMFKLTLHFKGKPDVEVDVYVEDAMPQGHQH